MCAVPEQSFGVAASSTSSAAYLPARLYSSERSFVM
jgi:hypothetical protein